MYQLKSISLQTPPSHDTPTSHDTPPPHDTPVSWTCVHTLFLWKMEGFKQNLTGFILFLLLPLCQQDRVSGKSKLMSPSHFSSSMKNVLV